MRGAGEADRAREYIRQRMDNHTEHARTETQRLFVGFSQPTPVAIRTKTSSSEYDNETPETSLANQPYFSSCACALGRGAGKGRKNTSGHLRQVFVSRRNAIIIQTIVLTRYNHGKSA